MTGSFSNQTKTEICGTVRKQKDKTAFLTGVLLAARRVSAAEIVLQTECEAFAALVPQLLQAVPGGFVCDTEFRSRKDKLPVWCFTLSGGDADALLSALQINPENRADSPAFLQSTGKSLCMLAAGAFVICGSITDPARAYHLEYALPDAAFAGVLRERIAEEQPAIAFRQTVRKQDTLLYLKQNEQICDALTYFGAQNASLSLAEQQIYKSFRSQTNRRTNCDLANIDKTVAAGEQQVEDILLIQRVSGLDSLPESLQEIAQVRLENPEANLRDLGAACNPPLSRSGVHHRLSRLAQIAAKLRDL
ncbi:MAG: DNA-binding protein WhiA [Oscillospiraceae bacterium]|nr:DNA-binding protein WhiA [Oscillospiraceae bacterium]